ncbi:MAG: heme biosynthesis HemY N-terminal domain-containing protein [Pseudomonadales bacterium]
MKLALFVLLVILLLGGLFGSLAGHDPGYVLLAYDKYSVETSLWFALGLLILAYILIRLVIFTLTRTLQSRGRLGRWFSRRSSRTAEERTAQGMLMFAEGEWAEAKRLLSAAGDKGPVPLINHLHAARAAHEMGDIAERDRLLEAAGSSRTGADFAVQLSRAEMQHDAADWEAALASLLQLKSSSPRHPKVQRLLAATYTNLEDWSGLAALIPGLRKTKSLPAAEIDDLHRQVLVAEFGALSAAAEQADAREALWKSVPKKLRDDADLVSAYTAAALLQGSAEAAEVVVRKAVDRGGDDTLIALYGTIATDRLDKQRSVAKAWQDARSGNAAVALTMGRLHMREQDWAKARESFETSLKLAPSPAVYTELGRLCCALGEVDRGAEYLRIGMPGLPELPLPKSTAGSDAASVAAKPSLVDVVEEAGRDAGEPAAAKS